MADLIAALQIFAKYTDTRWPTHCEHDILHIMGVGRMSDEDEGLVKDLGFIWSGGGEGEDSGWISYRFGSA